MNYVFLQLNLLSYDIAVEKRIINILWSNLLCIEKYQNHLGILKDCFLSPK